MKTALSVLATVAAFAASPVLAGPHPAQPGPQPHGPVFNCAAPGHKGAPCKVQPAAPAKPGKAQPAHPAYGKPQVHPAPHAAPHQVKKPEPIRVRIGDRIDNRFKPHHLRSKKLDRRYDYYELGDKLFRVDPNTQKILAVVGLIEAFSR